ncbi:putative endoplasmic reticulum membrane protein-like protein [Emericellopsis cladophorae]|uniref:Endoplasmic reticulum membrane protein-like protein n=1 Tax=Emericellopsis cladophorae TaxID=2686198 RepID=A0A9Q0BIG8_9HYPO|nr:putative endoplasmic reticulum membrane protein-like protein [Emericellopsis cladophorae]KAI6785900.1 putative endoplasmic reticulum membrane protein-like protein [Emericellopsis cladophorae]
MSLDLERQLVFYGSYHHNKVNVAIHIFCVPMILFSGFTLASYSGTIIPTPSWLTVPNLPLNLGTIGATAYAALYLLLEPVAGFTLAAICLSAAAASNYWRAQCPDVTLKAAIAVHVFCWVAQFVGHGAFEKRAPALVDNLIQALFLAPMFVWLEILFFFGYRPELQARVQKQVQAELVKFRTEQKNGKAQ